MLLVTGEPGIGKSALLAAVAAEAGPLGFRVGRQRWSARRRPGLQGPVALVFLGFLGFLGWMGLGLAGVTRPGLVGWGPMGWKRCCWRCGRGLSRCCPRRG